MNLQGMMVGNGATKWEVDVEPSFPATARWFNVIPPSLYDEFETNNCAFYFFESFDPTPATPLCVALWDKMNELTAQLNWYDLYRPTYDNTLLSAQNDLHENRIGYSMVNGEIKSYRRGYTMQEYTPWAKHMQQKRNDVILGDYMTDYMNREDVRAAFHIPTSVQGWEMCSSRLDYHEQDEASFWIYGVLKNKYRMMFYSGDTDGAVTTYGSKRWIKELAWGVKD